MPLRFRPSKFWRKCETCRGKGVLPAGHGQSVDRVRYDRAAPASGEVIADPKWSYCSACHGTGMATRYT